MKCPVCGSVNVQGLGDGSFCLDCDWDDLPVIPKGHSLVQEAIVDLVENCGFPESSVPDLELLLPADARVALVIIADIKALPSHIETVRFPEWVFEDRVTRIIEHELRIR